MVKKKLKNSVFFFSRYVDGVFAIIDKNSRDFILEIFNCCDHNLKFTIEFKKDKKINFLNMQMKRCSDNTIKAH